MRRRRSAIPRRSSTTTSPIRSSRSSSPSPAARRPRSPISASGAGFPGSAAGDRAAGGYGDPGREQLPQVRVLSARRFARAASATPRRPRARRGVGREGLRAFDLVTARALAPLAVVAEYAAPLLQLGRLARRVAGAASIQRPSAPLKRAADELGLEAPRAGPRAALSGAPSTATSTSCRRLGRLRADSHAGPAWRASGHWAARRLTALGASFTATWGPSTRSPTRRAASARRRPRSTSPPASPRPGYETLLVDIDPQCNATLGLGVGKDRPTDRLRRARRLREPR